MDVHTNADVLRRHGIVKPACCLCRLCEARRYVTQPAYWASVLCEPEIPEFAEWPMEGARGFEFEAEDEAELPEADLPFLFPLIGVAAAVVCVNTKKNYPPPVPWQTRANTELRPNHPTTGGRSRVHFVLMGI